MTGAIPFLKHWRAICKAEEGCKECPLKYSCGGDTQPDEMTDKKILALVGEVEMNYERKKKFGGYPDE